MKAMNVIQPLWARWPARLCLACVIGALVGPLTIIALPWLGLAITGAALLLPPLLALLLEPPYRRTRLGRILIGLLTLGVIALLIIVLLSTAAIGLDLSGPALVVCVALAPGLATLAVMAATAAPDGSRRIGAAIAVALAAWLGLGLRLLLPFLLGGDFSSTGPLSDFGSLIAFVVVALYCFSSLIAIFEGLVAEALRAAACR